MKPFIRNHISRFKRLKLAYTNVETYTFLGGSTPKPPLQAEGRGDESCASYLKVLATLLVTIKAIVVLLSPNSL